MKMLQRAIAAGVRKTWLWRNGSGFEEVVAGPQSRLLVDVSAIIRHDAQTGIQRVVRAVWSELNRRNGKGFFVQPVFATNTAGYRCAPVDFLERYGCRDAEPVKIRRGDKFLGLDLAAHRLPHYRDQLNAWKARGASIHLVVYDLLPLLRPDWFTPTSVSNFRKWYDVLRKDADQAICISDQVAQDLRQRLAGAPDPGPEIVRLQMAADIAASLPSTGISSDVQELIRRCQFRPAVLMVGTIEPRKGYDAALAAFEWLWRTRPADAPDLVIVGKPGWKTAGLQTRLREHAERGARLHWLTKLSDEALCKLYEACAGVLVASYGEGFGLPLLEASLFRKHVLARDLPVFREHGQPNVTFFSEDGPEMLGNRVMDLVAARKLEPPAAALASWSESVDDLVSRLGIEDGQCWTTEAPMRKAS